MPMLSRRRALAALVSAPAWSIAQQQDPAEVDAPQLQPGDSWEFEVVDLWHGGKLADRRARVVSVSADSAQLIHERQRVTETRARSREVLLDPRTFAELNSKHPSGTLLPFPLKPGQSWKLEYPNDAPRRGTNTVERFGEVKGWESVTVPAGTFRALRVELKDRRLWNVGDGVFPDHHYLTFWYVPEVKGFARLEHEHRGADSHRTLYNGTLLKSFSVG